MGRVGGGAHTAVESSRSWSSAVGYAVPVVWIAVLVVLFNRLSPWVRLVAATAGLLFTIKIGAAIVCRDRGLEYDHSPLEAALFWFSWPTVRPDRFVRSDEDRTPSGGTFMRGYQFMMVGLGLAALAVVFFPRLGAGPATWMFLFGLLFVGHLGVSRVGPFLLRWAGLPVPDLFDDPLKSESIGDFWSRRWNLPFVHMNRFFITRPFTDRLGFEVAALLAFLVSGALHELALSYASGGGWGLPFAYFLIQTALYMVERRGFFDAESAHWLPQKLWVWGGILLPLPLLFHGPFRTTFVLPVVSGLHSLLTAHPLTWYLDVGLWLAALGHGMVLGASVQVPKQLEWAEDLQTLKPLNRKVLWTYGGFIVLVIIAFGVLTGVYHDAFLAGTPLAVGLSAFIAIFWIARLLVDAFYFEHEDWPEGLQFVVGHALLTSLFLFLVVVYVGTIVYHLLL